MGDGWSTGYMYANNMRTTLPSATTTTSLRAGSGIVDENTLQDAYDALEANNKPVKKKVKKAKLIKKEEIQYFPTPKAMRQATGREKEVVVKEEIINEEVKVTEMYEVFMACEGQRYERVFSGSFDEVRRHVERNAGYCPYPMDLGSQAQEYINYNNFERWRIERDR